VAEGDVSHAPKEERCNLYLTPDLLSCKPNMIHQTSGQRELSRDLVNYETYTGCRHSSEKCANMEIQPYGDSIAKLVAGSMFRLVVLLWRAVTRKKWRAGGPCKWPLIIVKRFDAVKCLACG
jgi:hypothetical protein